ncbi:hypothetical protein K474DRAFT_1585548 [Panus rudis PR-1116 ss-1]|nr:hypothetical protein K474DRAFT_1585548 [Panus rudis PR-1116 ss-1]
MIFSFDDYDTKPAPSPWDAHFEYPVPASLPSSYLASPESTTSQLDYGPPHHLPPSDRPFDAGLVYRDAPPDFAHDLIYADYNRWIADPDAPSHSAPIDIPGAPASPAGFAAYSDKSSVFPDVSPFSPTTAYAALQPLPRSFSPSPAADTVMPDALRQLSDSPMSPADYHMSPPSWAAQLFHAPPPAGPMPDVPASFKADAEDAFATQRPRGQHRRDVASVSQMFPSSSAPSPSHMRPAFTRAYSRRAESTSEHDDRDATIRKKRRSPAADDDEPRAAPSDREKSPPLKSTLKPPKLAPSAWQLYFTDWIQRHQASSSKKLNVAQAAKEAGQEYARLSSEEKEPYKRRSQAMKEARERELAAYMRTLTPDDIKKENAFRTAQRKAGKSRRGNIKDPNAPKKPLSAYFMFLQRIRSDPDLVKEVFGDETETTKQSVLAAAKWRSMTDEERKPFLAQAEQEKLEYEAARKVYEEGASGLSPNTINFSILPGSPINAIIFPSSGSSVLRSVKQEALSSESESDDFMTDDGAEQKPARRV